MSRPTPSEQDQGVAFGPGCQPSASAPSGSSQSGIPNAEMSVFSISVAGVIEKVWGVELKLTQMYRRAPDAEVAEAIGLNYAAKNWRKAQTVVVAREVPAQAIEARSAAAAKTDAVEDESAVPKGCAQP